MRNKCNISDIYKHMYVSAMADPELPIILSFRANTYDELKLIYDKVEWNNKNSVLINILEVDER